MDNGDENLTVHVALTQPDIPTRGRQVAEAHGIRWRPRGTRVCYRLARSEDDQRVSVLTTGNLLLLSSGILHCRLLTIEFDKFHLTFNPKCHMMIPTTRTNVNLTSTFSFFFKRPLNLHV